MGLIEPKPYQKFAASWTCFGSPNPALPTSLHLWAHFPSTSTFKSLGLVKLLPRGLRIHRVGGARATSPAHQDLLDLITLVMKGFPMSRSN